MERRKEDEGAKKSGDPVKGGGEGDRNKSMKDEENGWMNGILRPMTNTQ